MQACAPSRLSNLGSHVVSKQQAIAKAFKRKPPARTASGTTQFKDAARLARALRLCSWRFDGRLSRCCGSGCFGCNAERAANALRRLGQHRAKLRIF